MKKNISALYQHILMLAIVLVISSFSSQEVFANESSTSTLDAFLENEILIENEINKAEVEASTTEAVMEVSIEVPVEEEIREEIVEQEQPKIHKVFKRGKVEPVKAPSHSFMKKPERSFPELKPRKGQSIPMPPLSAKALYRLYGIIEATTTESIATSTVIEEQPTPIEIIEEPQVISTSTSSTSPVIDVTNGTTTQPQTEAENGTSTPSEEVIEEIIPQTFIKPEEVQEIIEEVGTD